MFVSFSSCTMFRRSCIFVHYLGSYLVTKYRTSKPVELELNIRTWYLSWFIWHCYADPTEPAGGSARRKWIFGLDVRLVILLNTLMSNPRGHKGTDLSKSYHWRALRGGPIYCQNMVLVYCQTILLTLMLLTSSKYTLWTHILSWISIRVNLLQFMILR